MVADALQGFCRHQAIVSHSQCSWTAHSATTSATRRRFGGAFYGFESCLAHCELPAAQLSQQTSALSVAATIRWTVIIAKVVKIG